MIFVLAANLGGIGKGFLGQTMFMAGLLVMNTMMMVSAVGPFGYCPRPPRFQFVVTALAAIYRLAVGAFCLFLAVGTTAIPRMRLWARRMDQGDAGIVIPGSLSSGHHLRASRLQVIPRRL